MTSALDAGIELCGPGDNDRPASRFLAERVAGGIFFSPTVPGKTRRRVPMKFDAILQIHSNYSGILLVHTGPRMRRCPSKDEATAAQTRADFGNFVTLSSAKATKVNAR